MYAPVVRKSNIVKLCFVEGFRFEIYHAKLGLRTYLFFSITFMCGIFVSAICSKNSEGGADSAFQHICSKLRNVNALRGTFGSDSFVHQVFKFDLS